MNKMKYARVVIEIIMVIVLLIGVFQYNPQWVSNCHNGMNCAVQLGRHKTTDIIDDCPVCLENKTIIILKCNHKVCNNCWFTITKKGFGNDEHKPLCPLCRNLNDWSK